MSKLNCSNNTVAGKTTINWKDKKLSKTNVSNASYLFFHNNHMYVHTHKKNSITIYSFKF